MSNLKCEKRPTENPGEFNEEIKKIAREPQSFSVALCSSVVLRGLINYQKLYSSVMIKIRNKDLTPNPKFLTNDVVLITIYSKLSTIHSSIPTLRKSTTLFD